MVYKACPNLPPKSLGPRLRDTDFPHGSPRSSYRCLALVPWLTADNICEDKSKFLTLLYHRTASEPQDWVTFDDAQLSDYFMDGRLEARYSQVSIQVHGKYFGALREWDPDEAHANNIIGWPKAELVLEAQAKILRFLRATVEKIVEGRQGQKGSDKWEAAALTEFRPKEEQRFNLSQQAFGSRPVFDIEVLCEITVARQSHARDELRNLPCDPEFALIEIERLRTLRRLPGRDEDPLEDSEWVGVVKHLLHQHDRAYLWRWLAQEMAHLRSLHQKYNGKIVAGQDPPEEYSNVLGSLYRLVLVLSAQFHKALLEAAETVPAVLQIYFNNGKNRSEQEILDTLTPDEFLAAGPKVLLTEEFYGTIQDAVESPVKATRALAMIDDCLNGRNLLGQGQAAHFHPTLLHLVADFGSLLQIIWMFLSHRPRVSQIGIDESIRLHGSRSDPTGSWFNASKMDLTKAHIHEDSYSQADAKIMAHALEQFATEGWPKGKKDQVWLSQANRSHNLFDHFWGKVATMISDGDIKCRGVMKKQRTTANFCKQHSLLGIWLSAVVVSMLSLQPQTLRLKRTQTSLYSNGTRSGTVMSQRRWPAQVTACTQIPSRSNVETNNPWSLTKQKGRRPRRKGMRSRLRLIRTQSL
jgi:hypothetical protein